ncbi:hypothetical protein [Halorhodospira halophila]|uniref:Outer membrane protein beta-barrel domain-containing protein n=1 Tax=Halorhodospira halophila (strain DSM 244 / SL1) TaxID=349124 RepID=A1WTU7_HALHL|nr:hypothetical protein [Halorhodospira halophila]ABM61109.1 hypothetical protein Hhal_0315 [Halorhodospira halophila SL1]MBK1729826.1 hypothetical protein [Halorhodospira halophila]
MRGLRLSVLTAALIPLAATSSAVHAHLSHQPTLDIGVYGAWMDIDPLDDDLIGIGGELEVNWGWLLARGAIEGYEGQGADTEAVRGAVGLGLIQPWTEDIAMIGEVGGRYLDHDQQLPWGSDRADVTVEFGLRAWSRAWQETQARLRTDMRAVVAYPTDSDADPQAGGRLELSAAPAEAGFALFARGEWLSDERSAAVGMRYRY